MLLRDYKWLAAILFVLSSALAATAWVAWHQPAVDPGQRPIANWRPSIMEPEVPGQASVPATLDQALSRPLFRPSRRPFDPAAPAVIDEQAPVDQPIVEIAPAPQPPPQVSLKGVYLNGAVRRALIGTPESPESQWLDEGATILGWNIMKITPEKIILSSSGTQTEVKLYVDNVQQ